MVCLVGPQHGVRAGKTSPCLGAEPTLPRQPGGAGKPWETPGWIPQPGEVRTQGRERHCRCVRVWGTAVFKVGNNSSREDLNLPSHTPSGQHPKVWFCSESKQTAKCESGGAVSTHPAAGSGNCRAQCPFVTGPVQISRTAWHVPALLEIQ